MSTVAETRVSGFQASTWNGIDAPARTAGDVVLKLNAEVSSIVCSCEVQDALSKQGFETMLGALAQFAELIKSDLQRWSILASRLAKRQ